MQGRAASRRIRCLGTKWPAAFASIGWLLGCSTQPNVVTARQLPSAIQADAATVVASNNEFCLEVLSKQPAGNSFFSAFSLSTVLAMLDVGAAGQTDSELRTALHLTLTTERTSSAYDALLTSLDTGRSYGGYSLTTADRIFGQKGFEFRSDYLSTTKSDFHAELMPLDFSNAPDAARHTINDWVASQTGNAIPELFAEGSVDSTTRLVLANAITFRGQWAVPFDARDTANGMFHIAGGADVTAPLMHQRISVSVGIVAGGRVAILPFSGDDLSMLVFLPDDPDGLPQLEAQLSWNSIRDAVANPIVGDEVEVAIPRFSLGEKQDLKSLLPSLGIVSALSPVNSDFSGIDGAHDLYIQSGFHQATVVVDEHGAAASAGTGAGVGVVSALPPFTADHSFAFAIYDNVTGMILFFGRVQDPTLL